MSCKAQILWAPEFLWERACSRMIHRGTHREQAPTVAGVQTSKIDRSTQPCCQRSPLEYIVVAHVLAHIAPVTLVEQVIDSQAKDGVVTVDTGAVAAADIENGVSIGLCLAQLAGVLLAAVLHATKQGQASTQGRA